MINLISKKEQAVTDSIEKHKELHEELNLLKVLAGLIPDKYVPPIDLNKVIRTVYEKYDAVLPVTEDEVIMMFSSCGELKNDFHIIKTKKISFLTNEEAAADEKEFFARMEFADTQTVSISEGRILDLIKKDKNITPEVIAKALKVSTEWVLGKIASLTKSGLIESKTITVGDDEQIERKITKPLSEITPPDSKQDTEISIKYSYEGPQDDRNRPFCAKMLELDRLYSRTEIERISLRLGYSVFDRRGGWWTKPNGTHSPTCRHKWQSNIIVKKRKA